jgi:hypothetical protein
LTYNQAIQSAAQAQVEKIEIQKKLKKYESYFSKKMVEAKRERELLVAKKNELAKAVADLKSNLSKHVKFQKLTEPLKFMEIAAKQANLGEIQALIEEEQKLIRKL